MNGSSERGVCLPLLFQKPPNSADFHPESAAEALEVQGMGEEPRIEPLLLWDEPI